MEFLAVIAAFIVFLIIMGKGYLAALNPASLIILIILSVAVGYAAVAIFGVIFGSILKILPVIIIIGVILAFGKK